MQKQNTALKTAPGTLNQAKSVQVVGSSSGGKMTVKSTPTKKGSYGQKTLAQLRRDRSTNASQVGESAFQGSEFFSVVASTASASNWSGGGTGKTAPACFQRAFEMYQNGCRLTPEETRELDKQARVYEKKVKDSCGWDDGSKENMHNLCRGIAIAKGKYDSAPTEAYEAS